MTTTIFFYIVRSYVGNLAAEKKVRAISAALLHSGYRVVYIRTLFIYSYLKNIFLPLPKCFLLLFLPLDYLLSFFLLIAKTLSYRSNSRYVISYNILLDTSLPAFILSFLGFIHWLQLEESQEYDNLSSLISQLSAKYLSSILNPSHLLCSKLDVIPSSFLSVPRTIIPGVYASSQSEEMFINNLMESCSVPTPNGCINLFYSGRLDAQRGIYTVLNLIKFISPLEVAKRFRWVICGYGTGSMVSRVRHQISLLKSSQIIDQINCSRDDYITYLHSSNICLNIIENKVFEMNSLPSKLVEYACFGKVVISTYNTSSIKNESIVSTNSTDTKVLAAALLTCANNINNLTISAISYGFYLRDNLSIISLSKKFSDLL